MKPEKETCTKPLLFDPIYKEKIWGGINLNRVLGKDADPLVKTGESWELSGYGPESSIVTAGEFSQKSLEYLCNHFQTDIFGASKASSVFPLLFKFIDAQDNLSVQVHPNDEDAVAYNWDKRGKTECWYVVDAKPNAKIIVGFKEGISLADIKGAIEAQKLDTLLNTIDITSGDVLFIPAGTVHAILEGTLLYEVQETSDITLRLYDWARVDVNGVGRELHVAESLKVLDTDFHNEHKIAPVIIEEDASFTRSFRVACRYFALEEYHSKKNVSCKLPSRNGFQVLTVIQGAVSIASDGAGIDLASGKTSLIPAAAKNVRLNLGEKSVVLVSWVPDMRTDIIEPLRKNGLDDAVIAALGGYRTNNDILPYL